MAHQPHIFFACALDGEMDDPRVLVFHELIAQLAAPGGPPAHTGSGRAQWVSARPEGALERARELLERLPEARCAIHLGAPALAPHLTLPIGPDAERARALCVGAEPGRVVLSAALLDVLELGPLTPLDFSIAPGHDDEARPLVLARAGADTTPSPAPPPALDDESWSIADARERAASTLALVERAFDDLDAGRELHLMATLAAQEDRILEVIAQTQAADPRACARLLAALSSWLRPVWMGRAALDACAAFADSWPLEGADQLHLRVLLLRALQLRRLDELDASRALLERVIERVDALDDHHARALNELALLALTRQDRARATSLHGRVLSLLGEDTTHPEVARAHKGLAVVASLGSSGMSEERDALILDHLERALSIARACEDRQLILLASGERANVLSKIDPRRAIASLEDVVELARALHVDHFVCVSLSLFTDVAIRLERPREARACLDRARAELPAGDLMGQWFVLQQDALICLFEEDFDRAAALTHRLGQGAVELQHPMLGGIVMLLERLVALLSGQLERFKLLRDTSSPTRVPYLELVDALGGAILARGDARGPALDALADVLGEAQVSSLYDEWSNLIWRHAIARFPQRFTALRRRPSVAVGPEAGWLVNTEGARVELAHRPYLHHLLAAFVDQHRAGDGAHLDTHELFEIGWPGQTASYEAMKNRVYVGISKLRGFGLRDWLLSGPSGYYLSPELCVVEAA